MEWRYSVEHGLDGHAAMAGDVRLLALAEQGECGARLYDWEGPWITLGRYQSPERDLVTGCPIPSIRRPTGGKAVLHGHDLTIGLAAPLVTLGSRGPRQLFTAYRAAIGPIVAAMRRCGLPAALAEQTPFAGRGARTSDCFAAVSPNDVVDERTGLKVCGCALRLTQSAVLLQASLPIRKPEVEPRNVILGGKASTAPIWDQRAFADAFRDALTEVGAGPELAELRA